MNNLTEAEKKVLGDFFDRLQEDMSNAGCNDYMIEDKELQKAVADYHNQDDPQAGAEPCRVNYDFIVLFYLRKKMGI